MSVSAMASLQLQVQVAGCVNTSCIIYLCHGSGVFSFFLSYFLVSDVGVQ
jgi:hypothetical protein